MAPPSLHVPIVLRPVADIPWPAVRTVDTNATGTYAGKRLVDLVGVSVATLLFLPLLPLVALAIKLESPGPVFFHQVRIGRHGRPFRIWKFRTMRHDAEDMRADLESRNEMSCGVLFKIRNDPRLTRIGRLLRRTSVDELPQLWNVWRGEMSMVGPRPAVPDEVAKYSSRERGRLAARPGLTCFWQVAGRCEVPFRDQVDMDLRYVEHASPALDLSLIAATFPAVLSMRGAY